MNRGLVAFSPVFRNFLSSLFAFGVDFLVLCFSVLVQLKNGKRLNVSPFHSHGMSYMYGITMLLTCNPTEIMCERSGIYLIYLLRMVHLSAGSHPLK